MQCYFANLCELSICIRYAITQMICNHPQTCKVDCKSDMSIANKSQNCEWGTLIRNLYCTLTDINGQPTQNRAGLWSLLKCDKVGGSNPNWRSYTGQPTLAVPLRGLRASNLSLTGIFVTLSSSFHFTRSSACTGLTCAMKTHPRNVHVLSM